MQFQLFFLFSLACMTILQIEGITEDRLFLISPRPRNPLGTNSCQIRTEKSKQACCVCPGDCNKTYPRTVSKTFSKGIQSFRLYFAIKGPGEKSNFSVHLYICPRNSTSDVVLQECLLKNPLRIIGTVKSDKVLKLDVEVPQNLTCRHCLIQWAITRDVVSTTNGFTKQYFGCSDIAILGERDRSYEFWELGSGTEDSHSTTPSTTIGTTQAPFQTSHGVTTPHLTTVSFCWAVGVYATVPGLKEWCNLNCMRGYCPISHCRCASKTSSSLSPSTSKVLTTPLSTTLKIACHGTGLYAGVNGMDQWCQTNCLMGYCPESHCKCSSGVHETTPVPLSSKTTAQVKSVCRAIGIQATVPGMHIWCENNCRRGYCPKTHCKCSSSAETTRPHQKPEATTPNVITTRSVSPTIATSTFGPVTNTTTHQPSTSTTAVKNISTTVLDTTTKQMTPLLSLRKRDEPSLYTPSDEFLTTVSQGQGMTSAKRLGSSTLLPIGSSSSTAIPHQTTSATMTTGKLSAASTVTSKTVPVSVVTNKSVPASTVTSKFVPASTVTSTIPTSKVTVKSSSASTVTSTIPTSKVTDKSSSASTVTNATTSTSKVTDKFSLASTVLSTTTPSPKVTSAATQLTKTCKATDVFSGVVGMDNWCNINCNNGYCPKFQCRCDNTVVATTVSTCRAIYPYDKIANMHKWCKTNCAIGYCPSTHCRC